MEGFRQSLIDISVEAKTLIMNSWSDSTKKNYKPYIKEWMLYAKSRNIDVLSAKSSINAGIDFLTHLFNVKKLGYSSVNTARSALSTVITTGDKETFGKHEL